ncbi:MAG: GNAT family N-acetyltransferase, partial [Pigmentiphaga sp.]
SRLDPQCQYAVGDNALRRQYAATPAAVIPRRRGPNLTRGCKPYGLIENVVTHAAFRGRGHAKALLGHALKAAWIAGCYKVMLMTGRKDEATLKFYESAGFDRQEKQTFIAKQSHAQLQTNSAG